MKTLILLIACFTSFATYAQKSKGNEKPSNSTITVQSTYRCPLHPEVVSDKPGKCTKCNMDLTLSKKEQMKMDVAQIYACPMHKDVVSNEPGKCPVCDKTLVLSKKEQMKMGVMNKYTCPMHGEVTSETPGKCAKCGMALTKVTSQPKSK